MANVTVRASSAPSIPGTPSVTIPFPGTPQPGDPVGIWLTTSDATRFVSSAPAGWAIVYATGVGTAGRSFLKKVYAASDGASVTISLTNTASGVSCAVVVLDGSVHADFGTPGTITSRGATVNTTTAAATGSTATPNLVVSHEKAATHPSAPTVSPATTSIQNVTNAAASAGSVFVGSYDTSGGTADRTLTYPTTSANGCAYQIPVLPQTVTPPPPSGPVVKAWNGTAEQTVTLTRWNGTTEIPVSLEVAP